MEPNQLNPSPDNLGIPQGIPTGVFVSNNQPPVQNIVQQPIETSPVQAPVTQVQAPVAQVQVPVTQVQVPVWEGALDKIFKWLAKFFAKVMWQPDPITWVSTTSVGVQTTDNLIGKVRGAANQIATTASNVAWNAVAAVNQTTQIISPPSTVTQPEIVAPVPVQQSVVPSPPPVSSPVVPIQ